jgi:hypothetical protein
MLSIAYAIDSCPVCASNKTRTFVKNGLSTIVTVELNAVVVGESPTVTFSSSLERESSSDSEGVRTSRLLELGMSKGGI